ncbi:MAG: sigma-70 family RNA polymerase sigma factor [Prolixibacteraceae bacterium]
METTSRDDRIKWDRFRQGDDNVLSAIYAEYAGSLYLYGQKLTMNRAVIEDALHDLFIDLIRNRKGIGETGNIHFYLLKAFRRKLIRLLKRESRYGDGQIPDNIFDIRYSAEQNMIAEEDRNQTTRNLALAIEKLSPRQKEAIYLRFQKELDYPEVAELLGMGVEASRNLIYRAIKSLKEALQPTGNGIVLLTILKKISFRIKKDQNQ